MSHSRTLLSIKLTSLLRRCRRPSSLKLGQQTHTQILIHGLLPLDPTLQSDLILMYSCCARLTSARHVFDKIPDPKPMHACNILISSYVHSSLFFHSVSLFSSLLNSDFTPDHFTLTPLFKACAAASYCCYGAALHCWVLMLGLDAHVVVSTAILDMYLKFGRIDEAREVFDGMHDKDVVVWNSMIAGLVRCGLGAEAMVLFRRLQCEDGKRDVMAIPSMLSVCGKSGELRRGKEIHGRVVRWLVFDCDVVIGNSLIEMYAKCGCIDDAYKIFADMGNRRNLISWSTMISCYGVHGKGKEALRLYNDMVEQGFKPNAVTFTSILSSCSHSGLLEVGHKLFDLMSRDYGLEPTVEHYACMVDLLGRKGWIQEALRLIEDMPMAATASVWGAMLSASVIHRRVEVAELAAYKLFELEPGNSSNYIALCGVYEMVGLWDDAAKMRARMRERGLAKLPGCSWIIMKGRSHFFYQGDARFLHSERVCEVLDELCQIMALRSSTYSELEDPQNAEPGNSSNYIALCGVYEMVGLWDDAAKMRARMRERGLAKLPGCSWIIMKGRSHFFYQGDARFLHSERVCEVLDELCQIMALRSSTYSELEDPQNAGMHLCAM